MGNQNPKQKENDINSLCKKYFTPELCKEPITETRLALRNKIFTELLSYGDRICAKNFYEKKDFLCEEIVITVQKCFQRWEKVPCESYSAYFYSAVNNSLENFCKNNSDFKNCSLSTPTNNESSTLQDTYSDKTIINPEEDFINKDNLFSLFSSIQKFIKAARPDTRKTLGLMFTYRILYCVDDCICSWITEQSKKYDFINTELVNDYFMKLELAKAKTKEFKYTQKDISTLFGIPEKTLSSKNKKIDSFLYSQKNCQ